MLMPNAGSSNTAKIVICVVNECSDARSNDCSPHAKCIDKTVGYTCRCVPGYADISPGGLRKPGRKCVPRANENKWARLNISQENLLKKSFLKSISFSARLFRQLG
ncbi:EGF-like domain protein [Ancylostoma caninum]|uniref:EGF-like domain protein n=1 Tax=Ancylostoma caninum TaxID=29170 RepID=A0A368GPD3_ANCCA|nr:EGF-like domain protein [Ancylostoma caninum]